MRNLGQLIAKARPSYPVKVSDAVAAKAGCGKAFALGKNIVIST